MITSFNLEVSLLRCRIFGVVLGEELELQVISVTWWILVGYMVVSFIAQRQLQTVIHFPKMGPYMIPLGFIIHSVIRFLIVHQVFGLCDPSMILFSCTVDSGVPVQSHHVGC